MFHKLRIHNYILIEEVEIRFSKGFNVITGETGAGKSVLMGALALIFGQRAESTVLKNKEEKCFIEAEIHLENNKYKPFFDQYSLDFEKETIVRREINPKGKSRAFINDTPVKLKVLEQFSDLFFDLHTQDQNHLIKDEAFRLNLIDTVAKTSSELKAYKNAWSSYKILEQEVIDKEKENAQIQKELDFIQYQFTQLEQAQLSQNEQELLEAELKQLNKAEEIKQGLAIAYNYLSVDEQSAITLLLKIEQELSKISGFYKKADEYLQRIQSDIIDLQDLAPELESDIETIEYNPQRIEEINTRLNLIFDLQHKHQVDTVAELLEIQEQLDNKLLNLDKFDFEIKEKKQQLEVEKNQLITASDILSKKRINVFKDVEQAVIQNIKELGMPKARFKIEHRKLSDFSDLGQDAIQFLFSANTGSDLDDLSKIASGGEISRLMLSLKQLWSTTSQLSTLILDEIDSGVSGEIADKMGKLMQQMAQNRQLIVITHLPQIAAKGSRHFKVQKQENKASTTTHVLLLEGEKRTVEIAQLLSGENISKAAIENAKELINS